MTNLIEIKSLKYNQLEDLLKGVEKPGRYIGCEVGIKSKDLQYLDKNPSTVLVALSFPDIYEIGMSNLGLQILYDVINKRPAFSAERVFSPWFDLEKNLRTWSAKLFSLENRIFLDCFDLVGFNAAHEMLYTNILNIIDLGGLEIDSGKRKNLFPLICAGGSAVVNPLPLSKFMDFMVIGDGEEVIISILEKIKYFKNKFIEGADLGNDPKKLLLKEIGKLEGIFVPGIYKIHYHVDGTIREIKPGKKVKKATVRNLDDFGIVLDPVIPNIRPVHDRLNVEIMRGCARGCRFCQAGFTYRPVRQRNAEKLIEESEKGIMNTGYDEISFTSLSSSDYAKINELLSSISNSSISRNISISLPSMRLDAFNFRIAELIHSGRRTGLTFAPEAGSQRLRDIIKKGISESELLDCINMALEKGWVKIKLYFMLGLPFEQKEDVEAIIDIIDKIIENARQFMPRRQFARLQISISINGFCPKPFTPFQWAAQDPTKKLAGKFRFISANIPKRFVSMGWTSPEKSRIECALARGNNLTSEVLEYAWRKGAKFDNWTDFFKYDTWIESFINCGADIDFYTTREIPEDEILPWDMIDIGIKKEFFLKEYEHSKNESSKPYRKS